MFLDQALSLYICATEMGVLSSKSTVIDSLLKLMTESSMKPGGRLCHTYII